MKLNNHYSDEDLEEKIEEIEENFENSEESNEKQGRFNLGKIIGFLGMLKLQGLKVVRFLFKYSITGFKFTIRSLKKLKLFISTREEKNRLSVEDLFNIYLIHHYKMMLGLAKSYSEANSRVNNKIKKEPSKNADIEDKVKWKTEVAELEKIRDNIYANLKTMASEKIDVDKLDIFEDGYRFGVDCIKKDSKLRSNFIKLNVILFIIFKLLKIDIVLIVIFMLLLNFLSAIMVYNYYINIVRKYLFNSSRAKILVQNQCISAFNTIVSEQKKNLITVPKEDNSFELEAKSKIEDRTDYSAQQHEQEEIYDNPYVDTWRTIFDELFPKNIKDKFKVPEYKEFEMIEVHIFNIPTLTVDILIAKSEEIGSYMGKRVYKIQRDYDGKIGRIGVKLITKEMPNIIPYSEVPETNENEIVIGKSVEGFVTWRFTTMPHGGVYGTTGGGKSKTMQFLINELEKKQFLLYFADFKGGVGFNIYKKKNYTVIAKRKDFAEFITQLYMELKYRNKMLVDFMAEELNEVNEILISENKPILPRIFLIIDEFADAYSEEDKYTKIIKPKLNKLLAKGRAIGIHIFIGTQRPDASIMGGGAPRNNIPFGMTSRQKDTKSFKIALGADKISKEDWELIRRIPDVNFQGLFIVQGTDTINGKELVRVPFMEKGEYYSRVLNKWKNNPHADYELHYMSLDDEEDEDSEEDVNDEYDEVLNMIQGKNVDTDAVEVPYEVIEDDDFDLEEYLM